MKVAGNFKRMEMISPPKPMPGDDFGFSIAITSDYMLLDHQVIIMDMVCIFI